MDPFGPHQRLGLDPVTSKSEKGAKARFVELGQLAEHSFGRCAPLLPIWTVNCTWRVLMSGPGSEGRRVAAKAGRSVNSI
jgi:hypothetical protein